MERWQQIEAVFQEALQREVPNATPMCAKPATATPICGVKSPLCWQTTRQSFLFLAPRLRRRRTEFISSRDHACSSLISQ
jgi:hypothetical protein